LILLSSCASNNEISKKWNLKYVEDFENTRLPVAEWSPENYKEAGRFADNPRFLESWYPSF